MGLGPVHAATPILKRHGLGLDDVDAWEINEAFAAQVIACERAWADDEYCRTELELPGALGRIDADKLNVDGGAIALGHPVGASGARIVLHVLNVLRAPAAGAAWRRSASAAGRAARCWSSGPDPVAASVDAMPRAPNATPCNTGRSLARPTASPA